MRFILMMIVSIGILISIFNTDISGILIGIAALLGVATWGYSSKEVVQIIKN